MIHGKQQRLLYSLLITLSYGQAHGALVGASTSALVAGSVESTYAMVAREAFSEAIGTRSGSSVVGSGSEPIMSNVSAATIAEAFKGAFDETTPSAASEASSSDEPGAVSEQVELREATEAVLRSLAHNPNMIQYSTRVIADLELKRALQSISLTPSAQPSEALMTKQYVDALYNTGARQQQVLFNDKPEFGVIPKSEVQVLAPIASNGLVVATPPVTYECSFSPKQKAYLLISYLAENTGVSLSDGAGGKMVVELAKYLSDKPWESLKGEEKKQLKDAVRSFALTVRKWWGPVLSATGATLQAQAEAEQKAQGAAIDLLEQIKIQFNKVKDSGIVNLVKRKWSGKQNPSIEQLFIGSDLPVLKQYVEGALEVMVYDLVPYSNIMKMGESVNELSTEFAKKCTAKSGQDMLNFMIFGAAVIAGGSAAMSDDENGIKARLDASYVAMQLKMGEKPSSADLVKTFGELAWYSVTGKVLTLDPKKYATMVKVGKIAQGQAKEMIGAADEVYTELVPLVQLVKGAMIDITASQAYGLKFDQPIATFIADVQKLNPGSVNPSLTRIASTMEQDPRAAFALQGALFDVMSNATAFDKAGWFAAPVVNAFKRAGKATTTIVESSDSSAGDVVQATQVLQQSATVISGDWAASMKATVDKLRVDVNSGVLSVEQATNLVVDQTVQLDALAIAASTELRDKAAQEVADQAVRIEQERQAAEATAAEEAQRAAEALDVRKKAEADAAERVAHELAIQKKQEAQALQNRQEANQQALNLFAEKVFADIAQMQQEAFDDLSKSVEEMASVMSAQRNKELQASLNIERKAASRALFKANVSADARLFAASLKHLKMSIVTSNDVAKMLRRHPRLFQGIPLESSDRKYLQGYLQGVAMINKDSVDAARVVPAVDLMRAIARR